MTVASALARFKLDLCVYRSLCGTKGGMIKSMGLYFFLWKRKQKSSIGNRISVSGVKRAVC